ncbi:MAG: CAAX prenyl protease-related protein [Isosphaeraceae bacterium]
MDFKSSEWSWALYVAPMACFLAMTACEGSLPGATEGTPSPWYPAFYALKVAAVVGVLVACRSTWRDYLPIAKLPAIGLAAGLGLLVAVVWVGIDGWYPSLPFLGKRVGFNPMTSIESPAGRYGFLAVRMFGLVAMVPFLEELFWRSFLIRWIINPEIDKVPVGTVTPVAAAITSLAFAAAHPEWLPAILTGAAWAALLWRTKSLSACLVSHSVANLGLGAYAMATGEWKFL